MVEIKIEAFFEVKLNIDYAYVGVVDAIACRHSNDCLLDPRGLHNTLKACEDGLCRIIACVETSVPGHSKGQERMNI